MRVPGRGCPAALWHNVQSAPRPRAGPARKIRNPLGDVLVHSGFCTVSAFYEFALTLLSLSVGYFEPPGFM